MKLEKLKITSHAKVGDSGEKSSVEVKINPASYKHKHSVDLKDEVKIFQIPLVRYFRNNPEEVSFDIYFDSTGAVPDVLPGAIPVPGAISLVSGNLVSVDDQIKQFKDVCYNVDGDIHQTNFLEIVWGSLNFSCRLVSLDIDYTMFKSNGSPLRAKASVTFKQEIDEALVIKNIKNNSPDLTHKVIVKSGDNLPAICQKYYSDYSYYLEVAKYNGLINIKRLKPGTEIHLPPIN